MIYPVTEQTMNGTVTLNTNVFGIDAENFEDAKRSLLHMLSVSGHRVTFHQNESHTISYRIGNDFPTIGIMNNNPLIIYEWNG